MYSIVASNGGIKIVEEDSNRQMIFGLDTTVFSNPSRKEIVFRNDNDTFICNTYDISSVAGTSITNQTDLTSIMSLIESIFPSSSIAGTGSVSFPSSVQRTPSFVRYTTSGTISAGSKSVSILNSGSADGTVLGQTLKSGESVDFIAPFIDTLSAISYNATGTEFVIITIV